MSDSLTILISKIQAFHGDNGTIFTTETCTAAVRAALKTFNLYAPVNAGTLITGANDQYEYELSDEDPKAIFIADILLKGNSGESDVSLTFDQYNEDERLFFRLREPVTSSDTLIARYTIPHTVNGLDSEVESTLPAWQDPILVIGAAAQAVMIRARAKVESINLSKDQSDNYRELYNQIQMDFIQELKSITKTKLVAVGAPDARAWNDEYHSWEQ